MPTIPSIKRRLDGGDSVAQVAGDEGASGPTVRKYRDMDDFSPTVKAGKSEPKRAKDEFLHLEWAPAEAQADFGVCDFRVLGVAREVRCLVVTFPFSNVSLAQRLRGESPGCAREGPKAVFGFCGGVPERLVLGNAAGAGKSTPASAAKGRGRPASRTRCCARLRLFARSRR